MAVTTRQTTEIGRGVNTAATSSSGCISTSRYIRSRRTYGQLIANQRNAAAAVPPQNVTIAADDNAPCAESRFGWIHLTCAIKKKATPASNVSTRTSQLKHVDATEPKPESGTPGNQAVVGGFGDSPSSGFIAADPIAIRDG